MRIWAVLGLVACGGGGEASRSTAPTVEAQKVAESLLMQTWQVAFASPETMAVQSGQAGWQAYFNKDYSAALEAFSGKDARALARMHSELSAVYRQAALLQANAIEQTYGESQRRDGDPIETLYLLGVSEWIQGKRQEGLNTLQAVDVSASPVAGLRDMVSSWSLDAWPSGGAVDLGTGVPGSLPELPSEPHYAFPEPGSEGVVEASEPALSLQLAAWHEESAMASDPGAGALLDPWRLAEEQAGEGTGLESADLFLSAWSAPEDVAFFTALRGSESVDWSVWAARSPLAAAIESCVSSAVNPECVGDQANGFERQIIDAMRSTAGQDSADHSLLAAFAKVGVFRAGVRAAAHLGDENAEGILRVATLDASTGPLKDPVFLVEMAAWDSANRNANRAQDLLHTQRNNVPGIEAIRTTLNALTLRVSRDAGGGIPMH